VNDSFDTQTLIADAEAVLRERAASLAREAEEGDETERLPLLMFRVGDEWYAVRLSEVREIMQDFVVTPLPCVPEFIQGVTNVRGEILSVSDAARLMRVSGSATGYATSAPAVVVTADAVATALMVDEIGDIIEVVAEAIEPAVSAADRNRTEFVSASVDVDGRVVALIDTSKILTPVVTGGRY
jgi:purine-binding chemotaxis protein CheW